MSKRQFKKSNGERNKKGKKKCTQLQYLALPVCISKFQCSKMCQNEGSFLVSRKWRWQFKAGSHTEEQGCESIVLYHQSLANP